MNPPLAQSELLSAMPYYRWVQDGAYWDWYLREHGHWHLTVAVIERIMKTIPEDIPRHLADPGYNLACGIMSDKELWIGVTYPTSTLYENFHTDIVSPILQKLLEKI